MNNDKKNQNPLDQAINAMRRDEAPESVAQAAAANAWKKISGGEAVNDNTVRISGCEDVRSLLPAFRAKTLPAERALLVEDHLHECVPCRQAYQHDVAVMPLRWKEAATPTVAPFWNARRFATAAAVLFAVALSGFGFNWYLAPLPGDRAHLQSAQGPVFLIAANTERPLLPGVAV